MAQRTTQLATLMQLRKSTRDQRRVELADACRTEEKLRNELDLVCRQIVALQTESRQATGPGTIDLGRLAEVKEYELALRAREADLQQRRNAALAEVEQQRLRLIEADCELRVLEKLQQRRITQSQRKAQRIENQLIDEAAARQRDQMLNA